MPCLLKTEARRGDPPEIYNSNVYLLVAISTMGGMIFGYDIGSIGGVIEMKSFKISFGLLNNNRGELASLIAKIVSILQVGCLFGALSTGVMADRIGRKRGLIVASIIFLTGSIIQTTSDGHLGLLYAGRFIGGIGVGQCSMITPLYTSECVPRAIRGKFTGCYQLNIAFGIMVAFWINYCCNLKMSTKPAQWQTPLALQSFLGLILLIGMLFLPDSPRWLAYNDQFDKAARALEHIRELPSSHPYIQTELREMKDQVDYDKEIVQNTTCMDLLKELVLVPANRKRIIFGVGIMVGQQLSGANAINYYSPMIFKDLGLNSTRSSLFVTGLYGIAKFITTAVFLISVVETLGRRRSLIWTAFAQGFMMFYVAAFIALKDPHPPEHVSAPGIIAVIAIFMFVSFYSFGWGPVPWIFCSEIFSCRLRGICTSITTATQWLFNFIVARLTPIMICHIGRGGYGCFILYGSFCCIAGVLSYLFIPETKGLSLERMDDLF